MELALQNIRVIDATQVAAGPVATGILAQFGAEVIHVESPKRLDITRSQGLPASLQDPHAEPWNQGPVFNYVNANKLGITIDLTTSEGCELFKALTRISDVVVDNYRPGVMKGFGLGYEELSEVNPSIIVVSMPIFGSTGPEAQYRGYGIGVEMIAGATHLTGYQEGPPMKSGIHHGDAVEAAHAAAATLVALWYRRRTGKGQHIDSASNEANIGIVGEHILDFLMNDRVRPRMGNRHHSMAPHGCYRCQGEDKWLTIAVASDQEWQRLCDVMGCPDLTADARFSTAIARKINEDALDEIINRWTEPLDHYTAARVLQAAGIAAAPVLDTSEIVEDPHFKERGFVQTVVHKKAGEVPVEPVRVRLSKTPGSNRVAAPCFGEHNEYVFNVLLGMSAEEIASLEQKGIVGATPLPATESE